MTKRPDYGEATPEDLVRALLKTPPDPPEKDDESTSDKDAETRPKKH